MLTSPTMPLEMEQGLVSKLRLKGVGYVRSRTQSPSPPQAHSRFDLRVRLEGCSLG